MYCTIQSTRVVLVPVSTSTYDRQTLNWKISIFAIAGDEEKAYWDKLLTERAERRVFTKLKKNDSKSRNAHHRAEARL